MGTANLKPDTAKNANASGNNQTKRVNKKITATATAKKAKLKNKEYKNLRLVKIYRITK